MVKSVKPRWTGQFEQCVQYYRGGWDHFFGNASEKVAKRREIHLIIIIYGYHSISIESSSFKCTFKDRRSKISFQIYIFQTKSFMG